MPAAGAGPKTGAALALGVFAAVVMTFAVPGVAQASPSGVLINERTYSGARGCVTVRGFPIRLRVDNRGAAPARVYLLPGCTGGVTKTIEAGRKAAPIGASVLFG
ncbi:hypothetical protein NRB56_11540 [Nocardia sp. RB56]|uniref:Uncharacterized protein n=2 Tax=Nocardia aurantia TaxID=2585199 RepID=A0A7K0DIV6_9NOCA|nr:hypothetical protein [Nocardia aurantia]